MSREWWAAGGGAVGALVGGQVGAFIGAGLGAVFGSQETSSPPLIDAELGWLSDPDGLILRICGPNPAAAVVLHVYGPEGRIRKGREPWQDEDGDFLLATRVEEGVTILFLAHGGTQGASPEDRIVVHWLDSQGTPLGVSWFDGLPRKPRAWTRFELFRPMVHLAMMVGRADGGLERVDVKALRAALSPETREDDIVLKGLMKEPPFGDVETLARAMVARMPGMGPADLLSVLLAVAVADGTVEPEELEIIAAVADVFEVPETHWRRLASEMGIPLGTSSQDLAQALNTLGLTHPASRSEAKRAYRDKMRTHHPDRFEHLGSDAVARATEETLAIKRAYEFLLATRYFDTAASSSGTSPQERTGRRDSQPAWQNTAQNTARPKPKPQDAPATGAKPKPIKVGDRCVVRSPLSPVGRVTLADGRVVKAVSNSTTNFPIGARLVVVAIEGWLLVVDTPPPNGTQGATQRDFRSNDANPNNAKPREPSSAPLNASAASTPEDEYRVYLGFVGGIIGFFVGLPAGGIGALPAALIGATIGYHLKEASVIGCAILGACIFILVLVALVILF